jgi:Cu/Ag efflux protein CusF
MRKLFTAALALPFVLSAGMALADQVSGTVEKVDASSNTVWIGGSPYQFEAQTAPVKFSEVKAGDKLELQFERAGNGNIVYEAKPGK